MLETFCNKILFLIIVKSSYYMNTTEYIEVIFTLDHFKYLEILCYINVQNWYLWVFISGIWII